MEINRYTFTKTGNDKNLNLFFSDKSKTYSDGELKSFIKTVTSDYINEDKDVETIRFSLSSNPIFSALFIKRISLPIETYTNNFFDIGFEPYDIDFSSSLLNKSFYLFEVYSTKDIETQIFLGQTYLKASPKNIHINLTNSPTQSAASFEGLKLHIQEDVMHSDTFNNLFLKIFFFNSKNGVLYEFKDAIEDFETYFPITINKTDYTFDFETGLVMYEDYNELYETENGLPDVLGIEYSDITGESKTLSYDGYLIEKPNILTNPDYEP